MLILLIYCEFRPTDQVQSEKKSWLRILKESQMQQVPQFDWSEEKN